MIELRCPCGFKSKHDTSTSGRLVRCKRCRTKQRVPAEPSVEEILRALEERKRERTHHYVFAHRVLPEVAFQDPRRILCLFASCEASNFLVDLWDEVGRACPCHLPAEGLGVSLEEVPGLDEPVVLIRFPDPEIPPEAHFLALVPWTERRFLGLWPRPTLRCFTLEQGIRLGGGLRTVLCEWSPEKKGEGLNHTNYGDGPAPQRRAFLERLGALLSEA
ncbi:MAG: hypothetical protein D6731_04230 [Planctomycetota bacterium]|nr:MAG: hypothetical protein D6731_04230 [Planctomycetota bacterium]